MAEKALRHWRTCVFLVVPISPLGSWLLFTHTDTFPLTVLGYGSSTDFAVAAHETPGSPTQKPVVGGIGLGSTVRIDFCASCSYRGNAATMKKMLETQFPGIDVVLVNYPPSLPKRVAAKLVPVFQVGVMGIVLGGEQIFPMIGLMAPPPWYYTLRANKFGTIASTWLLGNALQSFLQSSGAFEVYCNDELVFSKLMEARFPGEIELKDLVGRRLANSGISDILL
ncbi:hypothetical protein OIU78_008062 [Salix suchowensis]|nr:hypothetical protein OIU78_008062 [Salix suchowensis]